MLKYIFIHIPKTAGVFLKKNIDSSDFSKIIYLKPEKSHSIILQSHYSINFVKKYFKNLKNIIYFTVVRNPYDRIYSIWKFLNKQGKFLDIELPEVSDNFKNFIIELGENYYDPFYFFAPQKYFIQGEDIKNIKIFKFEEINTTLKEFCEENNVSWSYKKVNSTDGPDWETQYDDIMKEIVFNKYKEDFEIFGYSK